MHVRTARPNHASLQDVTSTSNSPCSGSLPTHLCGVQQGPGQRQQLLLPCRQRGAALPQHKVQASKPLSLPVFHNRCKVGSSEGRPEGRVRVAPKGCQVLPDAASEQDRHLQGERRSGENMVYIGVTARLRPGTHDYGAGWCHLDPSTVSLHVPKGKAQAGCHSAAGRCSNPVEMR